ncbi:hypothetical protein SLA2020_500650 [Shorea laevis]
MESMEIDDINESNGSVPRERENGFKLFPVLPEESGEGLPYAPVDFPQPGDVWRWKVGRRVALNGHYLDRYLYLPRRLHKIEVPARSKSGFASKLSVERYIRTAHPDADVGAFFASFSWKIPAKKLSLINAADAFVREHSEETEHSMSDRQSDGVACKAGNKKCTSLLVKAENGTLAPFPCDICCSEPRFCRDCCCILCSRTISLNYGGYSYFKCEAEVNDGLMCGHVAHVNCALRSYLAGTIGGSIGLDAEYYCRRCDSRTDLVSHVTTLLQTCQSIDSRDDIDKILSVGVCILRGSEKTNAKELLNHIESALKKLKCGTSVGDIWEVEENTSAICAGVSLSGNAELDVADHQEPLDTKPGSLRILSISSDYWNEYLKLEDEIEQVLHELKRSQELEYKTAEETLFSQKNYIRNLYQQLDEERSELSRRTSGAGADALLNAVLKRVDQIKREVFKLKEMEKVAGGFGSTPKGILKEHFHLTIED